MTYSTPPHQVLELVEEDGEHVEDDDGAVAAALGPGAGADGATSATATAAAAAAADAVAAAASSVTSVYMLQVRRLHGVGRVGWEETGGGVG